MKKTYKLKNLCIFAKSRLPISVVNPTQKFFTYHKGIVSNSFCSNTEGDLDNLGGYTLFFTNFYKLFTNVKISKQFISRCTAAYYRYASYTKRSTQCKAKQGGANPFPFRIFKSQWLQMVSNFDKAQRSFYLISGKQHFSLWHRFRFVQGLRCAYSSGKQSLNQLFLLSTSHTLTVVSVC